MKEGETLPDEDGDAADPRGRYIKVWLDARQVRDLARRGIANVSAYFRGLQFRDADRQESLEDLYERQGRLRAEEAGLAASIEARVLARERSLKLFDEALGHSRRIVARAPARENVQTTLLRWVREAAIPRELRDALGWSEAQLVDALLRGDEARADVAQAVAGLVRVRDSRQDAGG